MQFSFYSVFYPWRCPISLGYQPDHLNLGVKSTASQVKLCIPDVDVSPWQILCLAYRQAHTVEVIRPVNKFSSGQLSYYLQMCSGLFWSQIVKILSCRKKKMQEHLVCFWCCCLLLPFFLEIQTREKKTQTNGMGLDSELKQLWDTMGMVCPCNLWLFRK